MKHQDSVRAVALNLNKGEGVTVACADKERSLTVTQEAEHVEWTYRPQGYIVKMEGYGTEYRLEVPDDDRPPVLVWPSSSALGSIVKWVEPDRQMQLVAERTAADLGIPER